MLLRERTHPGLGAEPCLSSPAERPPSGDDWLHEIKHDGIRILARRDASGVRLITRYGNDFTARFPLAVEAVRGGWWSISSSPVAECPTIVSDDLSRCLDMEAAAVPPAEGPPVVSYLYVANPAIRP
jgi:hypothetical protein